jgi:hypothetical protein
MILKNAEMDYILILHLKAEHIFFLRAIKIIFGHCHVLEPFFCFWIFYPNLEISILKELINRIVGLKILRRSLNFNPLKILKLSSSILYEASFLQLISKAIPDLSLCMVDFQFLNLWNNSYSSNR